MPIARRRFLRFAASAVALPAVARHASAQAFPTRPVRIVVGFAAGGPTDVVARIVADLMARTWRGQPIIIENRPGAGTIIATALVAKSPPDGHTMLLANSAFVINPAVEQKLPYDPLADFSGISSIGTGTIALLANAAFAPSTVPELVALAKASAEPLNYATPGPRGPSHMAGEWLQQVAGIKLQHINYNGSAPALTDVIAGRVPIMIDVWHSSRPHVDAGRLKLIASASPERFPDAPNVPAIGETYPGFGVAGPQILVGPAGIPDDLLQKLSADVRAAVASKEFIEKATHLGITARGSTPAQLDALVRSEIARWTQIARTANLKSE